MGIVDVIGLTPKRGLGQFSLNRIGSYLQPRTQLDQRFIHSKVLSHLTGDPGAASDEAMRHGRVRRLMWVRRFASRNWPLELSHRPTP
jgi:hypothetical protein